MPNFYQLGRGGQHSPEAINRRRAEATGEAVAPLTKKDLIDSLVDKAAQEGNTVSQAQKTRWQKLTTADLQKLEGRKIVKAVKAETPKPEKE